MYTVYQNLRSMCAFMVRKLKINTSLYTISKPVIVYLYIYIYMCTVYTKYIKQTLEQLKLEKV